MAIELEWRFDDEVPDKAPREEQPSRRPRWPVWLGLVAAVLLLAGVGLYTWWRGRQEELTEVETEIQAVAQLELRALVEGDTDLYLSLQDDASPTWRKAQETRAKLNIALPPPLPGLTATTALSVESARVVGDVARVEVARLAGLPDGEMGPFRATRFYRRSDDGRWLHTRADLDYAGNTVTFVGEQLKIICFATDREWVEAIVPELDRLANRFCDLASCQWRSPLVLDFTSALDNVLESEEVMPAPFLVGVPDDEVARAAWEAGLRELLINRLFAREVGQTISGTQREPRGGELFRARFREWLQVKLELNEPNTPDLDLIGEAVDAGEWIPLWSLWNFTLADDTSPLEGGPREDQRSLAEAEIDLLLLFIEEEYGQSTVASLFHALRESQWMGILIWEAVGEDWPAFEHRYAAYVREVTGRPVEPPGEVTAFAMYDLVATCGEPSSLWGLRLDQPEMTLLSSAAGFSFHSWSPDGARLLAWRDAIHGGGFYLLEANGSGVRQLTSVPVGAWPRGWSPDSSHIAYSVSSQYLAGGLVDVEVDESVTLDSYDFAWSPDGSQLAYVTFESSAGPLLWLADGDGSNPRQVRMGTGNPIAWSPDGTQIASFGTYGISSDLEIFDVTTEETTTLLDSATLYDLLDIGPEQFHANANTHFWSPTGEWIGFGINQLGETETADWMEPVEGGVVLIRPDGSDPRVLLTREAGVSVADWSPDGRWLTCYIYARNQSTATVIGIDGTVLLEANGAVAWSPDGRYLALAEMDGLRILAVESGNWYSFESPARCGIVAWNPRGPLHEPVPGAVYTTTSRSFPWFDVDQCDLPRCQH